MNQLDFQNMLRLILSGHDWVYQDCLETSIRWLDLIMIITWIGISLKAFWKVEMGLVCCCLQVNQSTLAVKEQWGRFDGILEPGCHCVNWCFGSNISGYLTIRVQQMDVQCETKTKVLYLYHHQSSVCL